MSEEEKNDRIANAVIAGLLGVIGAMCCTAGTLAALGLAAPVVTGWTVFSAGVVFLFCATLLFRKVRSS